ncbi:hypothetical protein EVAR_96676_1 [Eumeta japonica]|uniref:Uncharacterized protein n=1 Tax=Eumeta variegata TaxID=151549 RepID=A0A4C1WHU1_EUMVA|nr:hypothetical protein EVAR_96676_1 [Eumeta japonica]
MVTEKQTPPRTRFGQSTVGAVFRRQRTGSRNNSITGPVGIEASAEKRGRVALSRADSSIKWILNCQVRPDRCHLDGAAVKRGINLYRSFAKQLNINFGIVPEASLSPIFPVPILDNDMVANPEPNTSALVNLRDPRAPAPAWASGCVVRASIESPSLAPFAFHAQGGMF